jgi:hypothetical protein
VGRPKCCTTVIDMFRPNAYFLGFITARWVLIRIVCRTCSTDLSSHQGGTARQQMMANAVEAFKCIVHSNLLMFVDNLCVAPSSAHGSAVTQILSLNELANGHHGILHINTSIAPTAVTASKRPLFLFW